MIGSLVRRPSGTHLPAALSVKLVVAMLGITGYVLCMFSSSRESLRVCRSSHC